MIVTHQIRIDLQASAVPDVVNVVQLDSNTRVIKAALYSGNVPFEIGDNASVSLACFKPDRTQCWYDQLPDGTQAASVDGNVITIPLAPEVLTVAGMVTAAIVIRANLSDQVSTFPFLICVARNPAAGSIISNNYYKIADLESLNNWMKDVLCCTPQAWTAEQQAQARNNIGAMASGIQKSVAINSTENTTADVVLATELRESGTAAMQFYSGGADVGAEYPTILGGLADGENDNDAATVGQVKEMVKQASDAGDDAKMLDLRIGAVEDIKPYGVMLKYGASGYYITADGTLTASGSWEIYKFDLSKFIPTKCGLYSNSVTNNAVAFYSSDTDFNTDTFLRGIKFPKADGTKNEFVISDIPEGAATCLVANRTATSAEYYISGNLLNITDRVLATEKQIDALVSTDYSNSYKCNILSNAIKYKDQTLEIGHEDALRGIKGMSSYVADVSTVEKLDSIISYCPNTYTYAVAFYNSATISTDAFISGIRFATTDDANILIDVIVPEGAVIAVFCNQHTISEDINVIAATGDINHYEEQKRIDELCAKAENIPEPTTVDLMVLENQYQTVNYGHCYAKSTGEIVGSGSWAGYVLPLGYSEYKVRCYTNDMALLNVAFYSGEELNADTLISGISFKSAGALSTAAAIDIVFSADDIPEGTKTIFVCSRTASGDETAITALVTINERVTALTSDVSAIKSIASGNFGKGNVRAIYSTIPNSNDFAIIKDEIWFSQNIYENGVATEFTTIRRYKIIDDKLIYLSTIDSDFGHWNTVDYCEENDCLVFTNAANATTTEGNFFTVVKNPLALGSVARIADCGIKYNTDYGFKIQAVWGDNNFGRYNMVYLTSNYTANIYKLMLLRDENGEFVKDENGYGSFIEIETATSETTIGTGGGDFWGDTLYIGNGAGYGYYEMSMSDYSLKKIERHYYYDDGTEYSGSTQGIHVDSDYIWIFVNVAGKSENYLIQYYR